MAYKIIQNELLFIQDLKKFLATTISDDYLLHVKTVNYFLKKKTP